MAAASPGLVAGWAAVATRLEGTLLFAALMRADPTC